MVKPLLPVYLCVLALALVRCNYSFPDLVSTDSTTESLSTDTLTDDTDTETVEATDTGSEVSSESESEEETDSQFSTNETETHDEATETISESETDTDETDPDGGVNTDPCFQAQLEVSFEEDSGGFSTASGGGGENFANPWEYGKTFCANNSSYCWGTRLGREYGNCESGILLSPLINLTACANRPDRSVMVSFWHYYEFEEYRNGWWDGGTLQFSNDNGLSWYSVSPVPDYSGIVWGSYEKCNPQTPVLIDGLAAWSGVPDVLGWSKVTVAVDDVFKTDAFLVRFIFGSDSSVTSQGWYIDNFAIEVSAVKAR